MPSAEQTVFGKQLAAAMAAKNVTATKLARTLGWGVSRITDYLSGARKSPRGQSITKLAAALKCTTGFLLSDGSLMRPKLSRTHLELAADVAEYVRQELEQRVAAGALVDATGRVGNNAMFAGPDAGARLLAVAVDAAQSALIAFSPVDEQRRYLRAALASVTALKSKRAVDATPDSPWMALATLESHITQAMPHTSTVPMADNPPIRFSINVTAASISIPSAAKRKRRR